MWRRTKDILRRFGRGSGLVVGGSDRFDNDVQGPKSRAVAHDRPFEARNQLFDLLCPQRLHWPRSWRTNREHTAAGVKPEWASFALPSRQNRNPLKIKTPPNFEGFLVSCLGCRFLGPFWLRYHYRLRLQTSRNSNALRILPLIVNSIYAFGSRTNRRA
jgi:hypothetical protein